MNTNNNFGQYFTTNVVLKEKLLDFILNVPELILEPSIGQGDLVHFVKTAKPRVEFDMYEIDKSIPLLDGIFADDVVYGDFLENTITKKYVTIIGNPPFVRTKTGNLYVDFTKKCYGLLEENGELIFIVPSDFFKLTCASTLLNIMMSTGTFTHIFYPNNEKLFANASIDVIVYRYLKNNGVEKKVNFNGKLMHVLNTNGFVTFNDDIIIGTNTFGDYFDIRVGMISGKENVFKNNLGDMLVLNGENTVEKYICLKKFPCDNVAINSYLLEHKQDLLDRKIRNFTENNWFEWGALRNMEFVKNNIGKNCIYVYNLTRKNNVAFVHTVQYFGGNLIMLVPNKPCDLHKIVDYLNRNTFKHNFLFSNRFKIGHRQLCNSFIPDNCL